VDLALSGDYLKHLPGQCEQKEVTYRSARVGVEVMDKITIITIITIIIIIIIICTSWSKQYCLSKLQL
jgi:hypothetical protein